MIVLDVQQGTPQWERARLGIPTASGYDQIITPKTLKPSAQSTGYRNKLLAEFFFNAPIQWGNGSGFMERGKGMELEAAHWYEMQNNVDTKVVGFVMREDRKTGGSPDRLVGDDGVLEVKCPALHTAIGYLLEPTALAAEYRAQTQGYLYLTGRDWADIISYCPGLPTVVQRVEKDQQYLDAFVPALDAFIADLDACKERLSKIRQLRAA